MNPADKAREIVDECCGTCSSPDCECDKRQMEALITQALIDAEKNAQPKLVGEANFKQTLDSGIMEITQEKDFWREECGKLGILVISSITDQKQMASSLFQSQKGRYTDALSEFHYQEAYRRIAINLQALSAHEARCREKMGEKNDGT